MRKIQRNGRDVHRFSHNLWKTFLDNCGEIHRRRGSFPQGYCPSQNGIFCQKRAEEKGGLLPTFFEKGVAFLKQVCYNDVVKISYLPVAQLDSASDSDSEGRRFESFRVGQEKDPTPVGSFSCLCVRMRTFVEAPCNRLV